MMQNSNDKNIHRILVSLDFYDYGSSFIEPLVLLASKLKADLCGLFMENSELQQIANLPFSREITFPTAQIRNLNSDQISRHSKQHSESLRKMMMEFSQLSNVACSFKTTKGSRIDSTLNESYNFQLVVFLPEKYVPLKNKQSSQLVEIVNPVTLFYDNSKQAQKSVQIIKSLADSGDLHQLNVITMDFNSRAVAKQKFSFDTINVNFQHIDSYNVANIISLIGLQKTGLLILPLDKQLLRQSVEIRKILDVLVCPLLLVR